MRSAFRMRGVFTSSRTPPRARRKRSSAALSSVTCTPEHDGSLHLTLAPALYNEVLRAGWGEPHPISGTMLVFGPRDEAELEVVWRLVSASYNWATGN